MKQTWYAVVTPLIIMIVMGGAVGTEAEESPAASDPRISLHLEPAVQAILKQTMQEHLVALQAIVAALAREDYEKASAVAHEELGFPKHHEVMQQERGMTFPKKYQKLAMAHHQAAEDLAQVIRTKEMKPILRDLGRTINACVGCHQAYKL